MLVTYIKILSIALGILANNWEFNQLDGYVSVIDGISYSLSVGDCKVNGIDRAYNSCLMACMIDRQAVSVNDAVAFIGPQCKVIYKDVVLDAEKLRGEL